MSDKLTAEQVEALNKKLQSVAGTILNKSDEELASLYLKEDGVVNENFESDLAKLHSDNIQEIKDLNKTRFDDGYKKAQSEVLGKAESELNSHFKFEGQGTIIERVSELVKQQREEAVKGLGDKVVTEADVKKHELFVGLQNSYDELKTGSEKDLNDYKKLVESEKQQAQVIGLVAKEVKTLNPIFNKNPAIAANQEADIIAKVASGAWGIEDGTLIPLDKDGVHARNDHNHPLVAKDLIKASVTQFFDLNQGGGGGSPANPGGQQDVPASDIKKLDNVADFTKAFSAATQAIVDAGKIKDAEKKKEELEKANQYYSDLRKHGKEMNFTR